MGWRAGLPNLNPAPHVAGDDTLHEALFNHGIAFSSLTLTLTLTQTLILTRQGRTSCMRRSTIRVLR